MKSSKNMHEEVEIIDIEENEKNFTTRKIKSKKKLKKGLFFRFLFCFVSIVFILGCFIFYGSRLIKYYRIYNPKDNDGNSIELLSESILGNASFIYEGEGLYNTGGNYIYKGENINNYIKYSNLIWRILKINNDRTIDIVLDSSINNLKWNKISTDFSKSDINNYLNENVLKFLNKNLITKTLVCNDLIDDISEIKCDKPDSSSSIRLLNIDEFLNSSVDGKSFLYDTNGIWLSSRGEQKAWIINGDSLSYVDVTGAYDIKPVVTLKDSNVMLSGNGSKENPYIIEEKYKIISLGDHIKLGEDIWTVYDYDDKYISLSMSSLYENGSKTYRFDLNSNKYNIDNEHSLAKYLNEDFYEGLSYKDRLVEKQWFIGEYNTSYKDIYSEKITAKVGLSSIVDLKFDFDVNNYYLLNGLDGKIYLYNNYLIESKPTLSRAIKPSIQIKRNGIDSGKGTLDDPYILEEK